MKARCPNCRVVLLNGECPECGRTFGSVATSLRKPKRKAPEIDPAKVPGRFDDLIDKNIAANPQWARGADESAQAYRKRMHALTEKLKMKRDRDEAKASPRFTNPQKHSVSIAGVFRCCLESFDRAAALGIADKMPVGGIIECSHAPMDDPNHGLVKRYDERENFTRESGVHYFRWIARSLAEDSGNG